MGAAKGMTIPMVAATGVRQTVNANLTPAQTTWNLRSALNVAALNCMDPKYTGLVDNYGAFLKRNAKELSATNRALQTEFRQRYGATYRDVQDSYMTQVYNYFALPPAMDEFCDVSFAISNEVIQISPADIDVFAATALPRIESVFEDFFRAYEQYRVDLAAWNSEYGPPIITTAVQGYTNTLEPPVNGTPAETVVNSMPVTQPGTVAGEIVPIDLPPTADQTPIVIATEETDAQGDPVITLPSEGPVFRSGEVVQGDTSTADDKVDDTPDPQN